MKRHMKIIGSAVSVFAMLSASTAMAQSMDYGALESLFGEPVTTSATGYPQRAPDVPVRMHIITAEEIRRTGATDIPDVLRHVPGMSVWRFARQDPEVSIRGYNQAFSPRLLILINGRQVYMDDFGYTVWGSLPVRLEEIRQIEVVKGPNTALFGFNAVAGVVNIVTFNPLYDDIKEAGARYGAHGHREAYGIYTYNHEGKIAARISTGFMNADEFNNALPAGTRHPDQKAINFDGIYQFDNDAKLRLELSRSNNDRTEYTPAYSLYFSKYWTNSIKASYTVPTEIGILDFTAYRNDLDKTLGPTFTGNVQNIIDVFQVSNIFQVGNDHRFRLQGEFRDNTAQSATFWGPNAAIEMKTLSASGAWNWQMRDDLAWSNGVRLEHWFLHRRGVALAAPSPFPNNAFFDKGATEVSYNSGLVWNATEKDTLRLMTARGIQMPTLIDFGIHLDIGALVPGLFYIGSPFLQPTIVTNYEIGYDRDVEQINGGVSSSVFFQTSENIFYQGVNFAFPLLSEANIGDSQTVGWENSVKGTIGENWRWDANYILQGVWDNVAAGGSDYSGDKGTPTHILNAHIGFTKGKYEADLYANYTSEYKMNNPVAFSTARLPAGGAIGLAGRAAYKFTDNVTFSISGQELNHEEVRHTTSPKVERNVMLGVSAKF